MIEPPPVLFPIGYHLGPFHAAPGLAPEYHVVRVGWNAVHVPHGRPADIWALTHGLPDRITGVRWTREAVRAAATGVSAADVDRALDHLVGLGVVAEVAPGTAQAVAFARTHRVQSLLVGLGNTADPAALDGIGLLGRPPLVTVQPRVMEFWQMAQLWPSLWAACEAFAAVARDEGATRAEETEPEGQLEVFLAALRILIASNAVFLDVVA